MGDGMTGDEEDEGELRPHLEFTVEGTPRPQGSKSQTRSGRMYEASKHLKCWREAVSIVARKATVGHPKMRVAASATVHGKRRAIRRHVAFTGPVVVEARFFMPRPKRNAPEHHTCKPDLDKLQRAIGDALTAADVFADDSQIIAWPACPGKQYAAEGESARVEVKVYEFFQSL